MKNKILIVCFLIFVCAVFAFGQANRKMSLIAVECQKYIPDVWCEPTSKETVAYHFENGALKNREVLMTGGNLPFEFRFPSDTEYVYQNRYLISDGGDVYDYKERKIIFRNNGGGILTKTSSETIQNLGAVKTIGERLIVKLAISNSEATNREGFYSYNLRTNEFGKVGNIADFPRLEAANFSPDDKTIAVIEQMKLVFYAVDANFNFKKLRSVDLDYAAPTDEIADDSEELRVVWADKQNVLTQNAAGEIVKVNVSGKVFKILKPKKVENDGKFPEISKDRFGNFLFYPCNTSNKLCSLNLQTRKMTEIDCPPLGNDFSSTFEKQKSNSEFWQYDFFYKGKSIGKDRSCFNAQTYGDYLAVEFADRNKKTAEIKVWNAVSKNWTNIKLNWHPEDLVVGWIEEK